jgi:hypothetical protein
MPLSPVQKGAIGQFVFLATALATGKGQVEAYTPAIDNEGRDAEIRRHLKAAAAIGIQVKVAFSSYINGPQTRARHLILRFSIPAKRLQNDARLWYFFAFYDPRELRFHDPVFLVPARVFHKLGRRQIWKGRVRFVLSASLGQGSRDQWTRYRLAPIDLGKHLLQIIDEAPLTTTAGASKLPPDSVLVGRVKRPMRSAKLKRAA